MTCSPILGQRELEFSGVLSQVGVGADEPFMSEIGTLLPIALCCRNVIVSTPVLHLCPCVVKAHKPMSVQAFSPELAIKTLDVAVVRGFARPREVEDYASMIGPEIEITRDEFAAIVHPNGGWVTDLATYPLKRLNDILALVAEARINCR